MPRLENWSIIRDDSNPFLAPELRAVKLRGEVRGHKSFKDGTPVLTSMVQELNIKNRTARTQNTLYRLGEPSADYVEWLKNNGKSLEDWNE